MRILLIGNTGQLGWELERALAPLGKVTSVDYPEVDLSNPDSVRVVITSPVSYTHLTLPTRSCQCRSRGSPAP